MLKGEKSVAERISLWHTSFRKYILESLYLLANLLVGVYD